LGILNKIFQNQLFKASSLNSLSILVRIITGFISSKAIAYFVGPSGMALMGNLRNFTSTIENIGILGLQNGIVQNCAKNNGNKELLNKWITSLFWIFCSLALLLSFIVFLGNSFFSNQIFGSASGYHFVLYFIAFVIPFQVLHLFFVAILNGFSEYKKVTAISVYSYVAGLLISLFLMLKFGINGALISISVLSVFQFLFSGYYFVQYFSFQLILLNRKIDFRNIKQILPLGLMTLFSAVLAPILYIFIRNLITKEVSLEAAGYYEAMQRISGFYMMFISTLITFYFLPELTKAKSLDKERKLTFAFYKGIIPIFGFGLVLIYFLRNFVIQVLLTKEFELVSDLFLWQLLGDFFRALALILGIRFYAKKMMKDYFVTEIISFTVLFSSSYLLIPKFGSEGAVMAYAVTYLLYFVILLFYFRKLFFKKRNND
jgi:PST family polysaccharide transporter